MTQKEVQILDYREFGELSSELIENTGGLRFRAQGRSMLPSIRGGDVITLEKADAKDLRLGDVVLIRNATDSLLAHRIFGQDGDTWTTCGDALNMHDVPFKADQLIGRVVAIERDGVEKPMSLRWARFMAWASRRSGSIVGRLIKKALRVCS